MKICSKTNGRKCREVDCRLKKNRNRKECISNIKFIHGDFDKDGIPNIDDKYPFLKEKNTPVNKEFYLSDTIRYLRNKRKTATPLSKQLKKKHRATSSRVKDVYSTINKSVRRNPFVSNDFIGLRYEKDVKRDSIKKKWNEFNKLNKIRKKLVHAEYTGTDDKYKTNKNTPNQYRAYHSNFTVSNNSDKFGVEYQFRTKMYGILDDLMHEAWKRQDFKAMKKYKKQARKLRIDGF